MASRHGARRAAHPAGLALALFAAVWHIMLMTSATNDNFVHMALGKLWLAGDWPVRDFFDNGWFLQYGLSAAALRTFGDRLLSEALVVGIAWGISTWLVFRIVHGLTGSAIVAALSALLLIVAGARGYSYPKGIAYAGAAFLWWAYVRRPGPALIAGFGAWTAVAFYWRPDHGVYVALGLILAVLAAHGVGKRAMTRCAIAGATALAVTIPFFAYVQMTVGLPRYVRTGAAQFQQEHLAQGIHAWPLIRYWNAIFVVEPREPYAPAISIRWTRESTRDQRRQVLSAYELTPIASDGEATNQVRLSQASLANLRDLVNEPLVEETRGVDRSTGTLQEEAWPADDRRLYNSTWRRLHVLPSLPDQSRASEFAAALFYCLPVLLLLLSPWAPRTLVEPVTMRHVAAFSLFALLVDLTMLRVPFAARIGDAVVLSAIVFGCCVTILWRLVQNAGSARGDRAAGSARAAFATLAAPGLRVFLRGAAVVLALAVTASTAGAGEFGERAGRLAGGWGEVFRELTASPPLDYFRNRSARFSLRLAAYVRECVPVQERLLVLWFEPEIYFFGDRLMAQRHLVFVPAWAGLADEQQATLEKVERAAPPVVLARQSALDDYAGASYPALVDYVRQEYRPVVTIREDGEDYLILIRNDRPPMRGFGAQGWPCFVQESSPWSQVGQPRE